MFGDLEKWHALRQSGRWWEIAWWRDPMYSAEYGLKLDRIKSAFDALQEVFSAKWVKDQADSRHEMLTELFGSTGLSPFSFLYGLGNGIRALRQKDLLGDLARRLRDAEEFEGACAEVLALAQWLGAGVKVERSVPSGNGNRNCDWKVSDGSAVIYGEVKRIYSARANSEKSELSEQILGSVLEHMGAMGICGEFRLQLMIRPETLADVHEFRRRTDEIAGKIIRHFKANRGKMSAEWQDVEGLAKYSYMTGVEPEGLHGGFSGIPYNMRDEGDKMMDVVEEAAGQLPSSGPGVVMISGGGRAAGLPFADETGKRIAERFRLAANSCRHVAGVLVVRHYLVPEHGLTQVAVFAKNPLGAKVDTELLKRGFPSLVIWEGGRDGAKG